MKVLFLLFHGFSEVSGITKKIIGQVNGLRENQVEVDLAYYDIKADGTRGWVVADRLVVALGKGIVGKLRKRVAFAALANHIIEQDYQLVYIRSFHNANPFTISFVKKLKESRAEVLLEIPTYPYDEEYQSLKEKCQLFIDKIFRKKLVQYVDAIVTFSEDKEIFGKRTIQISNGINFDVVPLHSKDVTNNGEINLIVVAEIHYWHGVDRVIKAMAEYYRGDPKQNIYLHVVGDYYSAREREDIEGPIRKYDLDNYVIRHGALFGERLDTVFNVCDFAIGSLGRHRTGIVRMRSLKNREYAARGLPFAYAESDPDFDQASFIIRFAPNEDAIDLMEIVHYLKTKSIKPITIRNSVEGLSWTNQMRKVLSAVSEMN